MSVDDKKPVSFGDPATEPVDLAQAFKMYNEANRAAAEEPVATGEDGGDGEAEPTVSDNGDSQEAGGDEDVESAAASSDEGGNDGSGGSSDFIEPVDYNARRGEILQGIQRQAIDFVRQDFNVNQITPCTIEELYSRDEQTGKVTFKNPDDPQHDFTSRAEAQAWVDAFNKQVESRFRQEVNRKQRELVSANAPALRLIDFAPKFNAMSESEQAILDDLIEPYAVRDNGGNVVGFNVDLDAMAAQAKKIAKRFAASEPAANVPQDPQGTQEQPKRPAVNMPTGTGTNADEQEPKSIGEALKMYDKAQREKGKK